MHGKEESTAGQIKQWINVISLLLIPLYHAWAGQQKPVD
jgi:hypothetical protein